MDAGWYSSTTRAGFRVEPGRLPKKIPGIFESARGLRSHPWTNHSKSEWIVRSPAIVLIGRRDKK